MLNVVAKAETFHNNYIFISCWATCIIFKTWKNFIMIKSPLTVAQSVCPLQPSHLNADVTMERCRSFFTAAKHWIESWMLAVYKKWWKSNTIAIFFFSHSFREANTHQVSISWLFDEFGLFGLRCHQPLPQPICLLAAEQKEEVRHGPWAKRAMRESAKPMEWKVDNCLFANKSPASERKRGYAAVCWTRLSRLQSKAREREKERGKEITVCWLHFILTMMFDIQSVSHPCQDLFFCSSSFCFTAPLIPSRRVGDDSKTTETIKEAMIKSSTLARVLISAFLQT